jgi:hypothetical protein
MSKIHLPPHIDGAPGSKQCNARHPQGIGQHRMGPLEAVLAVVKLPPAAVDKEK